MGEQLCPNCGTANRSEARFCQKCGAAMQAAPALPLESKKPGQKAGSRTIITDVVEEIEGMASDAGRLVRSIFNKGKAKDVQPAPAAPAPASPAIQSDASTRLLAELVTPKQPGEAIGGYIIQEVWPLQRSNYYKTRMERCSQGHVNPDRLAQRCSACGAELKVFLVRETDASQRKVDEASRQALVQLSRSGAAGLLRHIAIFEAGDRRYAVSEYPAHGWASLPQLELPVVDRALLVNWCLNLGQALVQLRDQNLAPQISALADYLEPIVIQQQQANFADLTIFSAVESAAPASEKPQQKAVAFLLQVLYILSSGKLQNMHRASRDFSEVPSPFRALLLRSTQSGSLNRFAFASVEALLDALKGILQVPENVRSLRQIAGYCTDVGRKRDHNEDFVGKYSLGMQQAADAPEVGLYLVADGMGGHEAGELASREVVRVILNEIQERAQELQAAPKLKRSTIKLGQMVSAGEVLKQAVQKANEVLYNVRKQVGSNRGTTLTAVLVVGNTGAVANVGDSRTYLWREGSLSQLTQDHSLVASLLAVNMIRPEEVRSHPQRNQVYRTLGERPDVEVDIYECDLRTGDRLLLCSDGLWEMVLDPEIQQLVQQATNPQEACDRLLEAANLAGGEDNISTVAVWMA